MPWRVVEVGGRAKDRPAEEFENRKSLGQLEAGRQSLRHRHVVLSGSHEIGRRVYKDVKNDATFDSLGLTKVYPPVHIMVLTVD